MIDKEPREEKPFRGIDLFISNVVHEALLGGFKFKFLLFMKLSWVDSKGHE